MKVHIPPYLLHRDALYDCDLRTADIRLLEAMWRLPVQALHPMPWPARSAGNTQKQEKPK